MSMFKYVSSPPIHNAFRWGNIHLRHGWQKAFCFLYLRWNRPRLTVLSQQDVWMPFHLPLQQLLSSGSPNWKKMAVLAQTGRGFMAMHSMWFRARQRFHLCWISTAERQGVAAWGEGHSSEDPSCLTLSLSSPAQTALAQASCNDITFCYPGTCWNSLCLSISRKSQMLQFTACTTDLIVFQMDDFTGL